MQNRRLGKDLLVSAIGLGCMGMSHAYGRPSTLQEARDIIAQALDCGYTFSIRPKATVTNSIRTTTKIFWENCSGHIETR